jgi:hypothetical protein
LRQAGAILASELAPSFRVETSVACVPQLAVDGHALLSLVRRVAQALDRATLADSTGHRRLELSIGRAGERIVLRLDAGVPGLDEVDFRRRMASIPVRALVPDVDTAEPVSLLLLPAANGEMRVNVEVPLTSQLGADAVEAPTGSAIERWWSAFDEVVDSLRVRDDGSRREVAAVSRTLEQLARLWPGYAANRDDILCEVETRAPWLREPVRVARAAGAAFHTRMQRLVTEADLALDRLEPGITAWLEDLLEDDTRLSQLLVDSMWCDLGTVD